MKNLLLISLDTLRADVAYSGKFPFFNQFLKTGVTFLNTISSAPITPISHATVFTGLQPYNHGMRHLFREKVKKSTPLMADILKKKGYETGAVVSCPGLNKWYGFNKGFNFYEDSIPRLADGTDPLETVDVQKRGTALKRANLVVEKSYDWLANHYDKSFFLFMHFFDAHWPYEAPEIFGGDNVYEQEVAYSLHYLEEFLTKVESNGWLDNTCIVIFSDHGEDLEGMYSNDKGGEKLGHPEESGHGCLLYDQTQKVILFIRDSTLPTGIQMSQQVRLVDILPTVLQLLGIKAEKYVFDGTSLVPIINGERLELPPAYSETFYPQEQFEATGQHGHANNKISLRVDNRYKLIFHLNSGEIECYDLARDNGEWNNLIKHGNNAAKK